MMVMLSLYLLQLELFLLVYVVKPLSDVLLASSKEWAPSCLRPECQLLILLLLLLFLLRLLSKVKHAFEYARRVPPVPLHITCEVRNLRLESAVSFDRNRLVLLLPDDLLEAFFVQAEAFALSIGVKHR
jgi:hypothetical protein